jgi:hypothetical protein
MYGRDQIEIDIGRLKADIEAGQLPGVEILEPEQIQAILREKIQALRPDLDIDQALANGSEGIESYLKSMEGLSKGQLRALTRQLRALFNTMRDGEWLIRGVIPKEYLTGPYPTPGHTEPTP